MAKEMVEIYRTYYQNPDNEKERKKLLRILNKIRKEKISVKIMYSERCQYGNGHIVRKRERTMFVRDYNSFMFSLIALYKGKAVVVSGICSI